MARLSLWCLAASTLGWIVVVVVALAFPGGHPPLSAYVTVPVGLATLPVSGLGLAAAWRARRRGVGSRESASLALVGNALILAMSLGMLVLIVRQSLG